MTAAVSLPLPLWLREQALYPKVYWKGRGEDRCFGALGVRRSFSQLPKELPDCRLFGAKAFSVGKRDPLWRHFPRETFWIPEHEVEHSGQDLFCEPFEKKKLLSRIEMPSFTTWRARVQGALQEIARGRLKKVVLARRTTLRLHAPVCPWEILEALRCRDGDATLFAFQMHPGATFLGATPEQLYTRQDRWLQTDALAGTRKRGKSQEEDESLERELLESLKEEEEFAYVKEGIAEALAPLCTTLSWEPCDRIVKTSTVQHRYNQARGELFESATDADLLVRLHPTPALGGFPRQEALHFLETHEEFDRGWYAAPLGWASKKEADLAVGIRSALIEGCHVHLFAGTGIVAGSEPEREWEELNCKIARFLEILI